MAALLCSAHTPAEVPLAFGMRKTVLQVAAPANRRLRILAWSVSFDGTSATGEPVEVRLLRQVTGGTMSTMTPTKLDGGLPETVQTAGRYNANAEPAAGEVLEVKNVHPRCRYHKRYTRRSAPIVGGGDRLGIECLASALGTPNCRAEILFEE